MVHEVAAASAFGRACSLTPTTLSHIDTRTLVSYFASVPTSCVASQKWLEFQKSAQLLVSRQMGHCSPSRDVQLEPSDVPSDVSY